MSITTKRVVVRYKLKPERVPEHEELVRAVFAALDEARPTGISYQALKLQDGLSFVHIATISTSDGQNPLASLPAFRAFTANIGERCDEQPASSASIAIGSYRAADAPP